MTIVEYAGTSDIRLIRQADFAAAGFVGIPDVVWNRANNFEVDIEDPILAAWLLAFPEFESQEYESFVDIVVNNTTYVPTQDTAANLLAANTVYPVGQLIEALDTGMLAIGDGVTPWLDLAKYRALPEAVRYSTTTKTTGIGTGVNNNLTGLAGLTVEVGDVPMRIKAGVDYFISTVAAAAMLRVFTTDRSTLVAYGIRGYEANVPDSLVCEGVISTPGTYNLDVTFARSGGSGTIDVLLDSAGITGYLEASPLLLS